MRDLTGERNFQITTGLPKAGGTLGAQGLWGTRIFASASSERLLTTTTLPTIGAANSSLSVGMWIFNTAAAASGVYLGAAGSWAFLLVATPGDTAQINMYNGSVNAYARSPATYPSNVWSRIVGVRDCGNSVMKVYRDGVDVTNTSNNVGFSTNYSASYFLEIGGTGSGNISGLTGRIDDVTIWNGRALTASDVWADYELSKRGYPGVLNRVSSKVYFTSPSVTGNWHYYQQQYALMGAA